ncbi:MAG: phosphate ABC transporter ATP-binding protein [Candidatus Verstraetearchaeota archaeon]|nr:phosphate ABC transporter ATP-binding protein [Candidatus Verstraetearchaeota archaeon]
MWHLELNNVRKRYSDREVLRGVTFAVEKGIIFSIMGPSGSGKTTLLRLLDGLEFPDSGEIYVGGKRLTMESAPKIRANVGAVFQSPVMFDASVYDNVAFSLRFRGFPASAIKKNVEEALKIVQLEDEAKRNALTLSGGEAQRVALARVLVYNPELILLDEPTANLDPSNSMIIESVLREARSEGKTVVLVTHNIFQAKRLADKMALLLAGEMIEIGDKKTFFESPSDSRTRRFIDGDLVC